MPAGDPFGYLYGPMPPLDPMMGGMPPDPYAAAHQFGKGQAGIALLSTAGNRNYASNLAQALGAYTSGRGSQMEQFQEMARQQQAQQMREAQLAIQMASQERLIEAEERKGRDAKAAEDRAAQERRYYLEQIPEEERAKFALAPLDALKKATETPERKTMKMDLGNREVLIDSTTGEIIEEYPQSTGGEGGRKTYRLDLGSRISVRDARTHEEIQSIPKDPSSTGSGEELSPGGLSASKWLDIVREENPTMPAIEAAREAERRAAASRRKVAGGPGIPVDREAAGALGNERVRPAQTLRPLPERPGASATPVRTPATAPSAPAADQIRSALPEALRKDPRVIAAIQRGLAQKKDPQTIIDDILGVAGGL